MKMTMPKCPYCNEELEYDEKLAAVCCDTDYYYETWLGFCPKCDKEFRWDENYKFVGYDNFYQTNINIRKVSFNDRNDE